MSAEKTKFDKVAYNNSFNAANYDRINLTVPKGQKEAIRMHAESHGESVNGFINRAIKEAMQSKDYEAAEKMLDALIADTKAGIED